MKSIRWEGGRGRGAKRLFKAGVMAGLGLAICAELPSARLSAAAISPLPAQTAPAPPEPKPPTQTQPSPAAPTATYRSAKLREVLERFRNESHFPGAVAGAWFADGSPVTVAVGFADRDRRTPMTEGALLHAGSVGKTFFAALAFGLVGEARLGLDDKVYRYLGPESWYAGIPNAEDITVRMLLNHTTGIPEYGSDFMTSLIHDPGLKRSPLDAILSVAGAQPLFAAGTAFQYTDVNFQLLQLVMERVTGKPATTEIQQRLLGPLRLTRIVPADRKVIPGLVPGYAGKDSFMGFDAVMKNGALILDPSFEGGGGGFVTNPGDLARWMALFCTGRAFPDSLLPEVMQGVPAGNLDLGQDAQSGLGVEIYQTPLGTAYGHGGFFPGYVSGALYYPERRLALAIQFNSSAEDALARPLRDIFNEAAQAISSAPSSTPTK
jgi:D-alanyl-D-alanine carboxypeptidase